MGIIENIKTKIANRKNYGDYRNFAKLKNKYIVIHYTGNDGDSDENNGNYFANNVVKASANYFVDSNSITQTVKDNYAAYAVGGNKYSNCSKTGGGKYYGKCSNANSISIELCDDVKNGKVYPSAKTIENALILTEHLMKKYGIPQENVIRHFDVNGKPCPVYWCGSATKEALWFTEFWDKIGTATASGLPFLVKVKVSSLNIRKDAGTEHKITGVIKDKGIYTITAVKSAKNGSKWGKLKSGKGFINIGSTYCKRM